MARALGATLAGDIEARDRSGTFDHAAWQVLAEQDSRVTFAPEHLGGAGHDFLHTVHLHEGLARGLDDAGLLLAAHAHLFGCLPILLGGHAGPAGTLGSRASSGQQKFGVGHDRGRCRLECFFAAHHRHA